MKYKNKMVIVALCTICGDLLTQSSGFALPPDPDNAAFLYYQAFSLYEKPDKELVVDIAEGNINPDEMMIKRIELCRPAIEMASDAAKLVKCNWGLKYSDGLDMQVRYPGEAKRLVYTILADARIALIESNYSLAVQRYITARSMAVHVGQDPLNVGLIVEKTLEKVTNKCIQDFLSYETYDASLLLNLKTQLNGLENQKKPIEFYLEAEHEILKMYFSPKKIQEVLTWVDEGDKSCDSARELILNADETFIQENESYNNKYWSEVFVALKQPYRLAYEKISELKDSYQKVDCKDNPAVTLTKNFTPPVHRIYNRVIQSDTFSNAILTALELYIIGNQTGKLPDSLPEGLAKDLFSGGDFEYRKTEDGFVLRCQGEDLEEHKVHEYEFKVKK